jgi:integrase
VFRIGGRIPLQGFVTGTTLPPGEDDLDRGMNVVGHALIFSHPPHRIRRLPTVNPRAALAGMDPAEVSGHSLRAGLATAAASAGVQERVIAQTTGHKSMTVLRRYIREGNLFTENAASAVGL